MQRNYIVALCAILGQHQAGVESEEDFGAGKNLAMPKFSQRTERSHLGFRVNLCALHREVVRCSQTKPGVWSEDRTMSKAHFVCDPGCAGHHCVPHRVRDDRIISNAIALAQKGLERHLFRGLGDRYPVRD
jgi:hypothetical protein